MEKLGQASSRLDLAIAATVTLGGDYSQYITEEFWSELIEAEKGSLQESVAASTLLLADQLLDYGNLRQATVEGVTALEVAIDDLLLRHLGKKLVEKSNSFKDLGIVSKATVVGALRNRPGPK